jgi:trimethylamine---corrinoid protein Co-methyltransferase
MVPGVSVSSAEAGRPDPNEVLMFVNRMPRYEILSPEAVAVLEKGWKRIVSEVGVQFAKAEALELFRQQGQKVEGEVVFFDPEFVLEQIAKAPREFVVQARNPANDVHVGGDDMVFSAVYGPPFVREGAQRRDATMDDFRRFTMLAQSYPELDSAGGIICEPNDTPLDSRHLDMTYALQTLSDKVYMGNVVSAVNAADTVAMTAILFGGRDRVEQTPATISLINCNSPLRWDDRMLDAQFEYNKANQPVVLTPFILMGAMSPVTVPAALAQQLAEALTGTALAQLVRPGCPIVFGSFLSNIDMQSGSPCFGTPESALGLFCTGQLARHYGLPFRAGGGLTSSQMPDAQAGYESLMTLLPTFLAGTNFVMHSAGWLEGGLVSCYEKFIIDVELLRMLREEFTPLEIDEDTLAFGAHVEVGHGGHFLGAEHTLEHFRDCFYRPLLSSSANFERWKRGGEKDAAARAQEIYRKRLEEYEQPPLDETVRAELDEYVQRRRRELGD